MNNIVNELDALRNAVAAEKMLRDATQTEFNQGVQNGPMRQAHDQSILNVLAAAQALLAQANS